MSSLICLIEGIHNFNNKLTLQNYVLPSPKQSGLTFPQNVSRGKKKGKKKPLPTSCRVGRVRPGPRELVVAAHADPDGLGGLGGQEEPLGGAGGAHDHAALSAVEREKC